jgi:hypothetical protein
MILQENLTEVRCETSLVPLSLVMKVCKKCWKVKGLGEFHADKGAKDGKY